MTGRAFSFIAGSTGEWRITQILPVTGPSLPLASKLAITSGIISPSSNDAWCLRGMTSNDRYVERPEKTELVARQPGLGRPTATLAALIPIRKSAAWWALTQDERRNILEEQSHHIQIGMRYLPAIARRLHHCRDLGENEPFDFLTWFEFSPADEAGFNTLVGELRASTEWKFVDREVDIRLIRE